VTSDFIQMIVCLINLYNLVKNFRLGSVVLKNNLHFGSVLDRSVQISYFGLVLACHFQ